MSRLMSKEEVEAELKERTVPVVNGEKTKRRERFSSLTRGLKREGMGNQQKVECPKCNKMVGAQGLRHHLDWHKRQEGTKTKPYPRTECPICGKMIGNNNIEKHKESHGKSEVADSLIDMALAAATVTSENFDQFNEWVELTKETFSE